MYIVQRASFRKDFKDAREFDALVEFDYMGSAEYEYGALPASKMRILNESSEYELFIIDELKSSTGVPLNLYCPRDKKDVIVADLIKFVKGNDPHKIISYRLKESIDFAHKYYGFVWSVAPCTDNFWWDLRNDFIFFYGAADRKNAFQRVIDHEIDHFNKNKESYDIEAAYKRLRMP